MNIKGILFDLDGVLLDTEGAYRDFWDDIDRQFSTGVSGFADVIKGSNLTTILNTYFRAEDHAAITALLDRNQAGMDYPFFPGAVEALEKIKASGLPMALVTSSDSRKMAAVNRQHPAFTGYFNIIVTGDMVSRPKPDPECFVTAAGLLGLDIAECLVVEDSPNGLQAGMAGGATVAGLPTTVAPDVVRPLCHHLLPDISHLPALLNL